MRIEDALRNVNYLFLDTAPVIYYVEHNPDYFARAAAVFQRVNEEALIAVTSSVTLAECLVIPIRAGDAALQQDFVDLIVAGYNTVFVSVDAAVAQQAAALRARYNLRLMDAFQIAAALSAGCEAFLTNDATLQRVTKLRVLVMDDLEL